ncbi:hypothetical protein [Phenylobacterium soli]|uniref:Uncharacterized protein n=1 Tax=Phenylobacterium soli TaxID=2170551 RepID=A0A328A998_9CAUL|nr:hypothetical protein [Phenylobacterium soli]RAK51151.1 hypothetical protein DJ017_19515 [Phenylobacterium soli]
MAGPIPSSGESAGHPAPARDEVGVLPLLYGLLAAPAAAALETLIGMGVVGRACLPTDHPLAAPRFSTEPIVWTVHLVALIVGVAAVLVSLRAWRRTRHEHEGGRGAMVEIGEGRTRFLAMVALLTSVGFTGLIVFNTVGLVTLAPC